MSKKKVPHSSGDQVKRLIKGSQENIIRIEEKVAPKKTWQNFLKDLGNKMIFAGALAAIAIGSMFTSGALAALLIIGGLMGAAGSLAGTAFSDLEERRGIASNIKGAKAAINNLGSLENKTLHIYRDEEKSKYRRAQGEDDTLAEGSRVPSALVQTATSDRISEPGLGQRRR